MGIMFIILKGADDTFTMRQKKAHLHTMKITVFTALLVCAAVSIASANAKRYNRQGVALGKQKKYNEALKEFDRAIKKYDKNSARAYHNRAWAHELKGNTAAAIKNYEEALRRNPIQVVTGEKLGFLYYKSGSYIAAVRVGEHVLKVDPNNKIVPKWLTDAYKKKLEQERLARLKPKGEIVEETASKKKEEKKKKEIHRWVLATIDYTIRTGYFPGAKKYKYLKDPGAMGDIEETIYISFTPIKAWEFVLIAENPWLGGLGADILTHREIFESVYKLGGFMLGIGFMFNHHESTFNFAQTLDEYDFKVGFLFGYDKKKMNFKLRFYPRLIPFDNKASTGYTFDAALINFKFTYTVNKNFRYYTLFEARDFYFFDHTTGAEQSNYIGIYDIGIGVSLGNIDRNNTGFAWKMAIEYRQRFYLQDFGNTDPYSYLPNGQGWFGMNFDKWATGKPFSGFDSLGYELSVRVDEQFLPYLFTYQKIIAEINDDHYEFNFQIGVGAMY